MKHMQHVNDKSSLAFEEESHDSYQKKKKKKPACLGQIQRSLHIFFNPTVPFPFNPYILYT